MKVAGDVEIINRLSHPLVSDQGAAVVVHSCVLAMLDHQLTKTQHCSFAPSRTVWVLNIW
jgi:hypothetical protein